MSYNAYTVHVHTSAVMGAALDFLEKHSPGFWWTTEGLNTLRTMYALGNLTMAKHADHDEEVAS